MILQIQNKLETLNSNASSVDISNLTFLSRQQWCRCFVELNRYLLHSSTDCLDYGGFMKVVQTTLAILTILKQTKPHILKF